MDNTIDFNGLLEQQNWDVPPGCLGRSHSGPLVLYGKRFSCVLMKPDWQACVSDHYHQRAASYRGLQLQTHLGTMTWTFK